MTKLPSADKSPKLSKLLMYTSVLTISSVLFSVFTVFTNQTTSLLVISLLILIMVLSLSRIFPYSNWTSFLFSSVFLAIIHYGYFGLSLVFLIRTGFAVLGYLITVLLCGLCLKQYNAYRSHQQRTKKLMDNLIVYDQETKLMRWPYARQSFLNELKRSRRYDYSVSLVFLDVQEKDLLEANEIESLNQNLAEGIIKVSRNDIDVPFMMDYAGIYLPNTNEKGAQVFAWRLVNAFLNDYQLQVSIGIASFPTDGVTVEELIDYTLLSLKFALETKQEVVCYSKLLEIKNTTRPETQGIPTIAQVEKNDKNGSEINELIENTRLLENEWFILFEDFDNMIELQKISTEIGQQAGVRLIHLKNKQLLITLDIKIKESKSFVFSSSGWALKEVDKEKKLVKLVQQ